MPGFQIGGDKPMDDERNSSGRNVGRPFQAGGVHVPERIPCSSEFAEASRRMFARFCRSRSCHDSVRRARPSTPACVYATCTPLRTTAFQGFGLRQLTG